MTRRGIDSETDRAARSSGRAGPRWWAGVGGRLQVAVGEPATWGRLAHRKAPRHEQTRGMGIQDGAALVILMFVLLYT